MKNLIEVSKIVTKKKVRKIEIFDSAALEGANSKFSDFYELLCAGKFRNDRDAAKQLYGCTPSHDKYRQLKSRFRKRLMNTLFFIDINQPSASNYDRAYFTCNKDWTLVKILAANNAHQSAQDLARSILTTSLKFKFADVIVNCCRILRQYAAESGVDKDFETYDGYLKQYSEILEAEMRSEELYQQALLQYKKNSTDIAELQEQLSGYCDALISLSEIHDSPIVNYNMYLVWAHRYELQRDYAAMLEVCGQAEKYIEDNPNYYQEEKLATFHLKKMTAYLHLRDFKNGRINVEKSLRAFPEGRKIWFRFMEYYLLLAFHTENQINAMAIFNRATNHPKFKKLDLQTKEKWKIYEAYINYFFYSQPDKIAVLRAHANGSFRLTKLMNDPIIYPRPLRTFSIHLVVAQFLFCLEKGNLPLASERVDRLRGYANKQLSREGQTRMINFIRLLQQLAKADYDPSSMTGHVKYLDRLNAEPFMYRGIIQELEIVPWEWLWKHILQKVRNI